MPSPREVRAGAAYVELTTRDAKLIRGLQQASKRLRNFGSGLQNVGTKIAGIGATAAAPIVASLSIFTRFDDAMRGVKAITQATEAEFQMLRDKAKELGRTTSYSASEVALLMTELGRAGFKPDEINAMTAAVMNLARATGTDAVIASGIFAATIRQFGLGAEDAARVADGLTAAANKSFNSVESLGEALKYAGPVAADANMSLEETLAILGTLGNLGIQGSSAGNAMKRLLTLSAAESEKFQKVFGVTTKDARGNARSLVDVLGEVADSTKNMGSADRAAKFNEVFGMLGITSASAIGKNVADTRELLQEIQSARGIAAETAAEMDSGIGGAFRILKSSIEGVAIEIGEALEGAVTSVTRVITDLLSILSQWITENGRTVLMIAAIIVGVTLLGGVLVGTGLALKVVAVAMAGFAAAIALGGAVVAAILSPLGLLIIGLVALGAYLLYASDAGSQALQWLGQKFTTLKDDAVQSFAAIGNALASGNIALAGKILWSLLKMEWTKGIASLTQLWLEFKYAFGQIASDAAFGAARLFIDAWSGMEAAWTESLAFLSDAWSLFTNMLMQTWNTSIGFIQKAWVRLKSLFDDKVDVQAEVQRIDSETMAKNQTSQQSMLDSIGHRDAQRRSRQTEIEQGRQAWQQNLDAMQTTDQTQRDNQFQRDLAQNQMEVDQARRQWQEAIAKVQQPDVANDPSKPGQLSIPKMESSLTASRNMLAQQQTQVEAKGTFNAFGLSGLGADSLAQRTASATEEVAVNTKSLVDQAKQGRLVFTA